MSFDFEAVLGQVPDPARALDRALFGETEAEWRRDVAKARVTSPDVPMDVALIPGWLSSRAPVGEVQLLDLLRVFGGNAVPAILAAALAGQTADGAMRYMMGLLWQHGEIPERLASRADWIRLAEIAGNPGVGGTIAERRYMRSKLLFRGQSDATDPGMTFSTSIWRASIYAFDRQQGVVLSARIRPDRVLFVTAPICKGDQCSWREIVVDPTDLDVEVVATEYRPGLWPDPAPRVSGCYCRRKVGAR